MIKRSLVILLLSFFMGVFSFLQIVSAERPINIVSLNVAPFVWCENGVVKGIDADVIKEVFKRIGKKYVITCHPWKRGLFMVKNGKADMIFPCFRTDEREKFATFIDEPLKFSAMTIFVKRDNVFPFGKIEDLAGKNVGLCRGYSAGPVFDNARKKRLFNVEEANDTVSNLKKLYKNRIDVFVQTDLIGKYYLNNMGLDAFITSLPIPVEPPIPTYIMVSKSAPIDNKSELLRSINLTIKEVRQDGTIDGIISRYLNNRAFVED